MKTIIGLVLKQKGLIGFVSVVSGIWVSIISVICIESISPSSFSIASGLALIILGYVLIFKDRVIS